MSSFHKSETTHKAYLGKYTYDFTVLSSEQVEVVYRQRGIVFPVIVSSTLQYIFEHRNVSVMGIARALDIPHQLAAQRVDKLIKLRLVQKKADPEDRRRQILQLTKLGKDQARRLVACMEDAAVVYQQLFEEIGCDLSSALANALSALRARPFNERFAELTKELKAG